MTERQNKSSNNLLKIQFGISKCDQINAFSENLLFLLFSFIIIFYAHVYQVSTIRQSIWYYSYYMYLGLCTVKVFCIFHFEVLRSSLSVSLFKILKVQPPAPLCPLLEVVRYTAGNWEIRKGTLLAAVWMWPPFCVYLECLPYWHMSCHYFHLPVCTFVVISCPAPVALAITITVKEEFPWDRWWMTWPRSYQQSVGSVVCSLHPTLATQPSSTCPSHLAFQR